MAKVLVYQMWPIAWPGGLFQMMLHLVQVKQLGATHVWLSPLYPSPRCDHGYDVMDYYRIDPRFGTMEDFDHFVEFAHSLELQVVMDLVLNHMSTQSEMFKQHPEYFCWSEQDKPGWKNLFNGGSAWEYDSVRKQYYLHLFHRNQADLNWVRPNLEMNQPLVEEFRRIVTFWMEEHQVDGFRLDVPQSINKDLEAETCEFEDLLFGYNSVTVINAVFNDLPQQPFLMMECFDPTDTGELVKYYTGNTPVQYVLNVLLKEEVTDSAKFEAHFKTFCALPGFMLDLESHDAPRFTSRTGAKPADIARAMFTSQAEAICLYQGQELGLENPKLDVDEMKRLDAQSAMRLAAGEDVETVMATSRANARVPIPEKEYDRQFLVPDSPLEIYEQYIYSWKKGSRV